MGHSDSPADILFLSEIDCFGEKTTFKNKDLRNMFITAQKNMSDFMMGKKVADSIIDIEQFAKLYALSDLLSSHHTIRWKNFRGYYNPTTKLIEPIPFDCNSGRMIY